MRVAVIGGTGHIGSYLTPMLFEGGHQVVCVCRGQRQPYRDHACWKEISYLHVDRTAEEQAGSFGRRIARIGAEAVIDLTCYSTESAEQLVNALHWRVEHLLHCGTIWVHGPSSVLPTTEDEPRRPFGDYGIRKAAIESWLQEQAREHRLPVTVLHPGHIVGPGWTPLNPQANFNTAVFSSLLRGEEIRLPNFGMETVHHVHAEDVAHAFALATENRQAALGESFHVVSATALTLHGYAQAMAVWFKQPARLRFEPWEEWKQGLAAKDVAVTEDHIRHSPHCSIEKARRLLSYEPRHTSLEAIQESVRWLMDHGVVRY